MSISHLWPNNSLYLKINCNNIKFMGVESNKILKLIDDLKLNDFGPAENKVYWKIRYIISF